MINDVMYAEVFCRDLYHTLIQDNHALHETIERLYRELDEQPDNEGIKLVIHVIEYELDRRVKALYASNTTTR